MALDAARNFGVVKPPAESTAAEFGLVQLALLRRLGDAGAMALWMWLWFEAGFQPGAVISTTLEEIGVVTACKKTQASTRLKLAVDARLVTVVSRKQGHGGGFELRVEDAPAVFVDVLRIVRGEWQRLLQSDEEINVRQIDDLPNVRWLDDLPNVRSEEEENTSSSSSRGWLQVTERLTSNGVLMTEYAIEFGRANGMTPEDGLAVIDRFERERDQKKRRPEYLFGAFKIWKPSQRNSGLPAVKVPWVEVSAAEDRKKREERERDAADKKRREVMRGRVVGMPEADLVPLLKRAPAVLARYVANWRESTLVLDWLASELWPRGP